MPRHSFSFANIFARLLAVGIVASSAAPLMAQPGSAVPTIQVGSAATPTSTSASPAAPSHGPIATKTKAKPKLPPAPKINVDVTEWVVFVADVSRPMLNGRELYRTDLPDFAEDLRQIPGGDESGSQSPADAVDFENDEDVSSNFFTSQYIGGVPKKGGPVGPSPIGLIRLSTDGPVAKDAKIDVQLTFTGGRALGFWPRAKPRLAGLLWEDLSLNSMAGEERKLPEGNWLTPLRGGSAPLVSDKTRESFLLYDIALNYPMRMAVTTHGAGKYAFTHTMSAPLHDLTFYKRDAHHWQTATFATVKGDPALAKQAESQDKANAAAAKPAAAQRGNVIVMANGVATVANPAVQPANNPAPAKLLKAKETEFKLTAATATGDDVLAPWRDKLAAAGVLKSDQDVVLKILARYALDSSRLTAIYRIDPAELDRAMPIEVVPQPKKISRIALVIVRGLDPAMIAQLDELLKQLGNPSWKAREAAMKAIRKAGVRARTKLQTAANDKDTELASRAEQLLEDLKNGRQGN